MKTCTKCGEVKLENEFYKNKKAFDGYLQQCKICVNKKAETYYKSNQSRVKERNLKYYGLNREKRKRDMQRYGKNNRKKIAKRSRKYVSERRKVDVDFKLRTVIRDRILKAVIRGYKKTSSMTLLGCTIAEVRQHLEKQFKPGMSWDNHGNFGWHIDHIIPCASFDLTKESEQLKCFHYTNLQPLWWQENLSKNDNIN